MKFTLYQLRFLQLFCIIKKENAYGFGTGRLGNKVPI